jgi:hypothetical protein
MKILVKNVLLNYGHFAVTLAWVIKKLHVDLHC